MDEIAEVFADQHGVAARRQLIDCGLAPSDLARMVRRRELCRVHPGVYVDHTGPLTWIQRAWAAVLFSWPAALSHDSALRAVHGPGRRDDDDAVIHVAVARGRKVVAPAGVRVHRVADLDSRVQWNTGPPRVRLEHAVLDVAGGSSTELAAVAVLAEACGSRRSTAHRLITTLAERPRQPRRVWLAGVLEDVAGGTCSVLEHGYLQRVERPHGLPAGRRQDSHRHDGVLTFRDVEYVGLGTAVELDGRLFHDSTTSRDRDMDRDLDSAAEDDTVTVRLSWGQVFDRPCRTADRLARLLTRRGWTGQLRPCPECG
ncbi:type IV toxin-antitoxin system AbiEi family antitoxin domain-containing protein [Nocardioides aquiterrae]|uniref:AbiEi antitoxin N-terminal domain-containing protein n=1 Tax=Nocardioides aquiterrae TaxID=203799 RepID=A0ABN1UFQ2_9ACTN